MNPEDFTPSRHFRSNEEQEDDALLEQDSWTPATLGGDFLQHTPHGARNSLVPLLTNYAPHIYPQLRYFLPPPSPSPYQGPSPHALTSHSSFPPAPSSQLLTSLALLRGSARTRDFHPPNTPTPPSSHSQVFHTPGDFLAHSSVPYQHLSGYHSHLHTPNVNANPSQNRNRNVEPSWNQNPPQSHNQTQTCASGANRNNNRDIQILFESPGMSTSTRRNGEVRQRQEVESKAPSFLPHAPFLKAKPAPHSLQLQAPTNERERRQPEVAQANLSHRPSQRISRPVPEQRHKEVEEQKQQEPQNLQAERKEAREKLEKRKKREEEEKEEKAKEEEKESGKAREEEREGEKALKEEEKEKERTLCEETQILQVVNLEELKQAQVVQELRLKNQKKPPRRRTQVRNHIHPWLQAAVALNFRPQNYHPAKKTSA